MRPHVAKSLENERNHFVVSLPTLDTPSWDGHPQFRFHAIDGTLTLGSAVLDRNSEEQHDRTGQESVFHPRKSGNAT